MGTENTEITVTAILDDSSLDKGFKKIATQAEKLSKTQTKGEQQSTASQKQAARIADKTRDKSKQDRKVTQRLQDFDKRVRPNLNAQEARHQEKVTRQKKEQERSVLNSTKSQLGLMQKLRTWQTSRSGSVSAKSWLEKGARPGEVGYRERPSSPYGANAVRTPNGGGGNKNDKDDDKGVGGRSGAVLDAAVQIGGAIAGVFTRQLKVALGSFEQQGRAMGRLEGMGSLSGVNDPLQVARSQRMGYSLTETYGHASMIGRSTGQVGATATAQEFSRIYGGSVEEVGGTMGQLTRGGAKFDSQGGGAGRRALSHLFRDAVSSGLDASRTGEHLEAVGGLAEMAGSRTSRNIDFGQISGMLALLGSSGKSGFQGARGASFLSSVDESIRSGGPDDSSKALFMQAMGHGYGGRNGLSSYQAEKRLEQGITGENGADTLDRVMEKLVSSTGGGEELYDTFSRLMNVSKVQAEDYVNGWQSRSQTGRSTQDLITEMQARGESTESRIQTAGTSTNLRVNRQDARLDNRSAAQGAQLYDSFADMQNLMNDVVDTTMPLVIESLNTFAGVIKSVVKETGLTFRESGTDSAVNEKNKSDIMNIEDSILAASNLPQAERVAAYQQAVQDLTAEMDEQRSIQMESGSGEERRRSIYSTASDLRENTIKSIRDLDSSASRPQTTAEAVAANQQQIADAATQFGETAAAVLIAAIERNAEIRRTQQTQNTGTTVPPEASRPVNPSSGTPR